MLQEGACNPLRPKGTHTACWWIVCVYLRGKRVIQCEKRFATFAAIPVLSCTRHWVRGSAEVRRSPIATQPHVSCWWWLSELPGLCVSCFIFKMVRNSLKTASIDGQNARFSSVGGSPPPHPPSAPQGEALFRDTGSECFTLWDPDPVNSSDKSITKGSDPDVTRRGMRSASMAFEARGERGS